MLGRHGPILPLLLMTRVFFHKAKVVLLECVFRAKLFYPWSLHGEDTFYKCIHPCR